MLVCLSHMHTLNDCVEKHEDQQKDELRSLHAQDDDRTYIPTDGQDLAGIHRGGAGIGWK